MQQRIEYIDRLKGFTMLLVVMGHITLWVLQQPTNPIVSLIGAFHMPLFMFLSGIVICRPADIKKCIKKLFRFWMPLVTVGIVYTLVIKAQLIDYAFNNMKFGYWYLYTLGFIYILMMPFRQNVNNSLKNFLIDIFGFALAYAVILALKKFIPENISNFLSLSQLCQYWQWFFLGYLFRKYNLVELLIKQNWIFTVCLISFIPQFYLYYELNVGHVYRPMAFCAIISFFYLFKKCSQSHSFVENELDRIGRHSMDVYIYHYFFVFPLGSFVFPCLGKWFLNTCNYLLEFIFVLLIAVFIAYMTILVGYIIKQSKILDTVIYGKFFK